jgi:acyl-CoA synthetase (AMP-forming)/AMP-acid ligase II
LITGAERHPLLAAEGIRSAGSRMPDKIAMREIARDGSIGRSIRYGMLIERMDRLGQAIVAMGLKRGDTAAIWAPNVLEYLEIVCGVTQAGVAIAKVSARLTDMEVKAVLSNCEAKLIFVDPAFEAQVRAMDLPARPKIIMIGPEYEALLSRASAKRLTFDQMADEYDTFVIPYTSGTTGRAKGVCVSHRSRSLTYHGMGIEYGCYGPDDHFLALAPLAHGAGFAFAMASIYFGGQCDLMQSFDPESTLRLLHEQAPSGVFFVPTHFHALFAQSSAVLQKYRSHKLRAIISNAAPLAQATKQKIVDYFGSGLLHECYGSTEGGIVANLRPQDQLRKVQCVGLPFANTLLKLTDDDGRDVGPNEIGELFSYSPYVFNGYWNMPEETAACIRDGWVTAGDLAVRDDEGFLYIVDRKKDMIITGGINVYPREIEEKLFAHPAVKEAAVVGVPDEQWGEKITAFIVLNADMQASAEELVQHCARELADYKKIRDVRWMQSLPRNAAGKVLKRDLKDQQRT